MLIRELITRCARTYRDHPAYVDGDRRRTWGEMDARSDRLAAALQQRGVKPGDAAAILSQDRLEVVEHWFACLKIGAVRVGINFRYSAAEVAHVLADSGATSLLVEAPCAPLLAQARDGLAAAGTLVVGFGGERGRGEHGRGEHGRGEHGRGGADRPDGLTVAELDDLMAETGAPLPHAPADADPVALAYTAGTTGMPKGVTWTHGGMREGMRWLDHNVGLRHEDRWLSALPAAAGPLIFVSMNLVNGMTTVLPGGRFSKQRFLELIADEGITSTMLVPTMLADALGELRERRAAGTAPDVSTLRLLCYGSMSATPAVIREARQAFGCEVQQWYGSTEMTGIVAVLRDADHAAALAGREYLLTSCGRPMLHADVQIRDVDGTVLPSGGVGELWVRSDTLFSGYHNRPAETAAAVADGWFRPGDIAKLDDEGYLYILDRKNFMIISGGYNVYPGVVEAVLAEHPAVCEVAVVGAPHERWGEAVAALVTLHPGAHVEPAELLALGHERLARWEAPKHVEIVAELPRGATGKINRRRIRDDLRARPAGELW